MLGLFLHFSLLFKTCKHITRLLLYLLLINFSQKYTYYTFINELILVRLSMDANIIKVQIIVEGQYKGQIRYLHDFLSAHSLESYIIKTFYE